MHLEIREKSHERTLIESGNKSWRKHKCEREKVRAKERIIEREKDCKRVRKKERENSKKG